MKLENAYQGMRDAYHSVTDNVRAHWKELSLLTAAVCSIGGCAAGVKGLQHGQSTRMFQDGNYWVCHQRIGNSEYVVEARSSSFNLARSKARMDVNGLQLWEISLDEIAAWAGDDNILTGRERMVGMRESGRQGVREGTITGGELQK